MVKATIPSKDERLTRLLLKAGIPVGPLFVGLSLIVGLTSSGFHFGKHEVSLLLVGSTGWLQMANFILTGMLGVATAVGLRRALHPGKAGTWGPILFGLYGIFLIIAGCFHPDPQLGFPSGAPQGIPSSPSVHATMHSVAFSLLALAIVASGFVFARRFATSGKRGWMSYSIASSVSILIFVFLGSALMAEGLGGLPLLGAAITISCWVSAIAVQTLRGIDENAH